jgi:hypothetical protein
MDMREIMMIIGGDDPDPIADPITVRGPVWVWHPAPPAKGAWHFLTIDPVSAAHIRAVSGGRGGGWGSVKVSVTLGSTTWRTSLFPHKESGGYMLPLKADVREREAISEASEIEVTITL